MRRSMFAWMTAGLLVAVVAPASAQTRDRDTGWWPWAGADWERDRRDRDDRDDRGDRDRHDRYDRDREAKKGGGPPFCRNGQGHPVHGRRWCEEKGWGSSRRVEDVFRRDSNRDDRDRRDSRNGGWGEVSWEDVILRRPTSTNRRLEQQTLRDILGATVLGRLSTHASRLGARGALDGRLVNVSGGSVLQLRAGGVPLAELTDLDRDGHFDLVLLREG